MSGLIETWLLKTVDGREIFIEPDGKVTLQGGGPNVVFEFRQGELPGDNKEEWSKKVSDYLGIDCVWLQRFYESNEIYGRPRNLPKMPDSPDISAKGSSPDEIVQKKKNPGTEKQRGKN